MGVMPTTRVASPKRAQAAIMPAGVMMAPAM
jgi:hypothetical protein